MAGPTVDSERVTDDDHPPGMPGWVRVSLIVLAALAVTFLILRLTGVGGNHGPGRHQAGASTHTGVAADSQASQPSHPAL